MRRAKVLVGVVAVAALALAACGDDSDDDAAPAATVAATPTSAATATTASSGTDAQGYPTGAAAATVSVVDDPELGEILVGPDGRTLYLFTADSGTTTACTGGCADAWPALSAASPTAGDGVDESKLEVVDGQVPDHVVYNGHLLYYYAKDTKPGDTLGTAIPKWFVLDPAGDAVEPG
jgi:predicted lipoprotein with Yx(FWY)xxD motif